MRKFPSPTVAQTFTSYPAPIRKKLMALRELIYHTAHENGVGEIEETLKWGEPAYLAKHGSTIRIAWKKSSPGHYAIYFNCKTNLIETFKTLFPDEFIFAGNRAIVFEETDAVPMDALAVCIAAALSYHRK